MVSQKSIADQLKKIGVNQHAWGKQEIRELPNIILPDEEIFECVNGIYEGGFALLVATDVRVLLIDRKPLNYLTVEDLRFDMINEIDYNHRAFGAYVKITTGNRELSFRSYNQPRLRKLINHVQNRMAEIKKKLDSHAEGQNQHLEQINGHLRTYLIEQYKHQEELQRNLEEARRHAGSAVPKPPQPPPQPSPELTDYLLSHGLLKQYEAETGQSLGSDKGIGNPMDEVYAEGMKEIFGDRIVRTSGVTSTADSDDDHRQLEVNPLRLAYSKLPMAMRNRKFGRPSLHAHSRARAADKDTTNTAAATAAEPQPG